MIVIQDLQYNFTFVVPFWTIYWAMERNITNESLKEF